nr:hypothetical protein [Tanacetum cinerariifolium]
VRTDNGMKFKNKTMAKFFDEIMRSSTTNVESSNVEIPSNEEEVFHESFESFQEESSSSSLNENFQQSSEEVEVPSTNTQSVSNNIVPNVDEATLRDADWVSVMQDELDQFARLKVWRLVPRPEGKTVIKTKWIFKNKKDESIIRIEAIRLFLAYTAHKDFTIFQMDVKIAFLNEILKEEVYVGKPPGFVRKQYPDHVYALDKSLYGLKQAPRAWYDVLLQFLIKSGFQKGSIDTTLFIKTKDKQTMEINANMVFMAQIEKVLLDSEDSLSSADDNISEVSYYLFESKSESEYKTLEYYDNTTPYGLFVNDNDDQEIFHDCENFLENLIESQIDHNELAVDHNDSESVDKLIRKFTKKIVKCLKRIEKANQQNKDFKNQNKDLQDKYDVLKNQATTFEMKNKELNEQLKVLSETNDDFLAQTNVLKDQLQVKHVVIDTHVECQEKYTKLEAE